MIIHKRNVTAIEPMIELPVTASEAIVVGEALKLNAGKLTKGTATAKPEYISVSKVEAGTDKVGTVIQVLADMEFEAEIVATEGANSLVVGDKVTIGTDGVTLTATKTSGVAEIVAIPEPLQSVGGKVIVRFN